MGLNFASSFHSAIVLRRTPSARDELPINDYLSMTPFFVYLLLSSEQYP
jgi:hypothetical protein